jgi:hypothetical protein
MMRLVDGVHAVVHAPPLGVTVASLVDARAVTLEDNQCDNVAALAHGLPDGAEHSPAFVRLARAGLAGVGLDPVDAVLLERLVKVGQGYQWQVAPGKRPKKLLELMRRANSQRKITSSQFGQTTCLPETAVARCLELTSRIGPRARILLVGDDDLLSVALASMGHKVSVLEIDPNLCRMLRRLAADEGVQVDTVCQDVRAPLPPRLAGAFDGVITDPMTFEPCLIAFLSRAAAALRTGGTLLCALHPSGAGLFDSVVADLPLRPREVLAGFCSYHDEGVQESWYHSDLRVLQRTRGTLRFGAADVIPFPELIVGAHGSRWHGRSWALASPWRRPAFEPLAQHLATWPAAAGLSVVDTHVHAGERWGHVLQVFPDGAHTVTAYDARRGGLCATHYPFVAEREASFRRHLAALAPLVGDGNYRCEVEPIRR